MRTWAVAQREAAARRRRPHHPCLRLCCVAVKEEGSEVDGRSSTQRRAFPPGRATQASCAPWLSRGLSASPWG